MSIDDLITGTPIFQWKMGVPFCDCHSPILAVLGGFLEHIPSDNLFLRSTLSHFKIFKNSAGETILKSSRGGIVFKSRSPVTM